MARVVLRLGLSGNEQAVIESVRGVRGLPHRLYGNHESVNSKSKNVVKH